MTDIRILSCPQCGFPKIRNCGNGLYQCDDCGSHFDKDENIVLTEQEWLQTATTEQLAEFIDGIAIDGGDAIKRSNKSLIVYKHNFWEEWLKQPHKE